MNKITKEEPMKKDTTKLAIVDAVLAKFNLNDADIVTKFFTKEVQSIKNTIKKAESNKAKLEMDFNGNMLICKEDLEDAKEELTYAYLSVNPEILKSNKDLREFKLKYWDTIESKKNKIDEILDLIKKHKDAYENSIEQINFFIADRQAEIDMITMFK